MYHDFKSLFDQLSETTKLILRNRFVFLVISFFSDNIQADRMVENTPSMY